MEDQWENLVNHNQPYFVNPAFQYGEPYTASPREEIIKNYSANHLIYRRNDDDIASNPRNNISRSNRQSNTYWRKIATQGPRKRRAVQTVNFGKSHTLGQSSAPTVLTATPSKLTNAPAVLTNAPAYNTSFHCPTRAYNCTSRHRNPPRHHDCVSFFDIETDQAPNYKYRPGEDVIGHITIIVRKTFEIKYVQLVTAGQGRVTRLVSGGGYSRTFRETYFLKDECCLEAGDVRKSSVLFPGQYTARFCVKLPKDLPSSIHHKDALDRFIFEVSYTLKARLCVKAGVSPLWHTSAFNGKVKVLLEKQIPFKVERDFDINAIPDAMSPIVHTEQVYLACAHQEPATVSVHTDRAVFLAGDNIRMYLQASLPSSQTVKDIKCYLQEHVITSPKHEPMIFTFSKITRTDPDNADGKSTNPSHRENFVVNVPTHAHLVSPYSLGQSRLSMEYFLSVDLRFTPAGGKLSFKIPVGIGPCAEPINAEKVPARRAIPFFNRTIRFPCFSARKLPESFSAQPSISSKTASVVVTTKYSNGLFSRLLLCCMSTVD